VIWSTRDLLDTEDKEVVIRTTLRELVIYLLFLLVIGTGPELTSDRANAVKRGGGTVEVKKLCNGGDGGGS
jgi:hypothetical protein